MLKQRCLSHPNLKPSNNPDADLDVFEYEFAESKELLEGLFPENDMITFAVPHGSMIDAATEYASKHYYAIRTTNPKAQPLAPESSAERGGWYAMYSSGTNHGIVGDAEAQWRG